MTLNRFRLLPLAALCFSPAALLLPAAPVFAQGITGSGIVPGTAENSAERAVHFASAMPDGAALVVLMSGAELPQTVPFAETDRAMVEGAIASAKFTGKANATLSLRGIGPWPRILLVGTGEAPAALAWAEAGGTAAQALKSEDAAIAVTGAADAAAAAEVALGYRLGQYRFDRYLGQEEPPPAQPVTLVVEDVAAAQAAFAERGAGLAEAVRYARDIINEPGNVMYPESFVDRTRAAFRGLPGVSIEVLDEAQMRARGMGAIVGVGQGSRRGSRMMVVTYRGADGPPLALVGKGISFDTGGISLKSGSGMWEMKADMSGAAAVMGAALSLAQTRAPVHVVAVAAMAENMPDGNAQRPGDIVRTLSGKTIEIRNTDAEGRLVLADALEYVAQEKNPFAIVNIATLTGSAVGALGPEYAGLFSRHDDVAQRLTEVAQAAGEPVWRLPLHPRYAEAVKSDVALVKNADTSPAPGASAGAHFLAAFVDEAMPWAHIDMAPTMDVSSNRPLTPRGMTGYGVRLLDALAREWRPEG